MFQMMWLKNIVVYFRNVAKINDEITVDYEKWIVGNILSLRFNAKETLCGRLRIIRYALLFSQTMKHCLCIFPVEIN